MSSIKAKNLENKDNNQSVRLSLNQKNFVEKNALLLGINVSEYIRYLIMKQMEMEGYTVTE